MSHKHAIILAGGKGTRLRPYTTVLPKPLLPIGDMPVVEIIIRQLRRDGFDRISLVIAAPYLHTFRAFLADRFPEVELVTETEPLGTAGPIGLVKPETDFLLINGDTLTTLSFGDFFAYHLVNDCIATVAVHSRTTKVEYGVIETDNQQRMLRYIEKPETVHWASMGVYAFKPIAVALDRLDIPELLRHFVKVQCFPTDAFWLDIGRPADYERAAEEFEKRRSEFLG